jgi:hypothetical protein
LTWRFSQTLSHFSMDLRFSDGTRSRWRAPARVVHASPLDPFCPKRPLGAIPAILLDTFRSDGGTRTNPRTIASRPVELTNSKSHGFRSPAGNDFGTGAIVLAVLRATAGEVNPRKGSRDSHAKTVPPEGVNLMVGTQSSNA